MVSVSATVTSSSGASAMASATASQAIDDGFANAPTGAPQYPNYFTSLFGQNYIRPPWHVAGVDYRVGPRGTLIDWAAWTPPGGVAYNGTGFVTFGNQSNLVIQGVDFTGDAGSGHPVYFVVYPGITNITFRDCRFRQIGPWTPGQWLCVLQLNNGGATNLEYCEIDGNGYKIPYTVSGYASDLQIQGNPVTVNMLYCWLHSAGSQNVSWQNGGNAPSSYAAKYCLIEEAGLAAGPNNSGVHGDWIYTDGWNGSHLTIAINFCTFKQMAPTANSPYANTQGVALAINASSPIYNSIDFSNNTMAVHSGAQINRYLIYSFLELAGTISITSNYVDSQYLGSAPAWINNADASSGVGGSQNGTRVMAGNIDMKTGSLADYGTYVSGSHTGPG